MKHFKVASSSTSSLSSRIKSYVFLAALGLCPALFAQITTKPVLRIESGTHSGSIRSIDGDREDRYLVSGSQDKTVRLWDAKSGKLLRTYRPPIGDGNDGQIYAVAMSPEGKTIAAGGFTGSLSEKISIYLFDRESGRLFARIGGLQDVILALKYSPDGRFLIARVGKSLRVYRTTDYSLVAEDSNYGGYGIDATTSRGGLTVFSSSLDGYIRIYELIGQSLRLKSKFKAPAGAQPSAVKLSPDGSRLAIGYSDVPAISIVRPIDSLPVCSPDISGLNRSLHTIAWSSDGKFLFAAGGHQSANRTSPVLQWAQGGCGARREIPGEANSIMALHSMHDGRIVFASLFPDIGIIGAAGASKILNGPAPIGNLLGPRDLTVSNDGGGVCVPSRGNATNCFSTVDRVLTKNTDPLGNGLRPPDLTGDPGLRISDWDSALRSDWQVPGRLRLNGQPVAIGRARSRALAIAPSLSEFLIATDFDLFLFDRNGGRKWRIPLPEQPHSINISGDGRTAIALLADRTVRWFSMADGKELLALFIASDYTRWVLWTPSGYYDASPGGEDLIGWNISTSRDAASDFYPASRFHARFYRPDVVGSILATQDEAEALRLANAKKGQKPSEVTIAQALPPIISLLAPADQSDFSSNEIKLSYSIRTPSNEPVTNLRILVDGRPQVGAKRISPVASPGGAPLELRVTVPQADCTVSLIAENRFASSEPASVQLHWRGATGAAAKPKLYVLAIGVSNYPQPNTLRFAAKDAQDFAAAMQLQRGRLYSDVETRLITNEQATRDRILDGFDWLEKHVTPADVALVLLSGHGVNDSHQDYYFLPVNFDAESLRRTAISFTDVKSTLERLTGKVVFLVDSCHSGNVLGSHTDQNGLANELSSPESGVVVFAASTGNQVAAERAELRNGVFTSALLEGIGGAADYGHDGIITVTMLDLYLSQRVKALTQGQQTPTTAKPRTIADFSVAALR